MCPLLTTGVDGETASPPPEADRRRLHASHRRASHRRWGRVPPLRQPLPPGTPPAASPATGTPPAAAPATTTWGTSGRRASHRREGLERAKRSRARRPPARWVGEKSR